MYLRHPTAIDNCGHYLTTVDQEAITAAIKKYYK